MTIASTSKLAALRIATIYALLAGSWILFSDSLIEALFTEPAQLVRASIIKGWLFVAVTSALVFVLVHRLGQQLLTGQRKQGELRSERRRATQLLESIADSSEDAIFAKDLAGRYILFNRAAGAFVGKQPDDVLGKTDAAIFPPEQAAMLAKIGEEIVRDGQATTHEERLATAQGERVFLATKAPLRDASGAIIGHFGIARDVTEYNRALADVRQLTDDLHATLHAIPDLLFELDANGRYIKLEATAEQLLAAPVKEMLGHTVSEVLPAEAATTVMAAIASARTHGSDYGRTISLPLPGGLHHFELSVACKQKASDGTGHFIVLSRDITARREAELELRRNIDELERFNSAAVGRELQMIDLKKQINELHRETGRPPAFDLGFTEVSSHERHAG
ncbi:hypothetical protein BJN45_12520 [Azonexus hydrophilus]|uniref:PAS domain S-box protein n=1 Tax=Azonexus hydrophilus TaxID=418702 RepID=A0A1R1I355_9RHOO|nr:PAS domain-containing protein [Azonexus hydrophilus]OMG53054.1 hypothetical protein BJN45_12520 [Azonexus hydrophilus]